MWYSMKTEAVRPQFMGQAQGRGRITPMPLYDNEGYAVLRCGGTEVVLSATLLHEMSLRIDGAAASFASLCTAQRALHAVTCEALEGETG